MELLQYAVGRSERSESVFTHVASNYAYIVAKSSTPSRLVWDANEAAVSLFWNNKMTDGQS